MSDKTKKYTCTVELNIFEDTDKANIEVLELALEKVISTWADKHLFFGTHSARTGNFYLVEESK